MKKEGDHVSPSFYSGELVTVYNCLASASAVLTGS
jgi:hypothetical protein